MKLSKEIKNLIVKEIHKIKYNYVMRELIQGENYSDPIPENVEIISNIDRLFSIYDAAKNFERKHIHSDYSNSYILSKILSL